jgi:hypothetical protein
MFLIPGEVLNQNKILENFNAFLKKKLADEIPNLNKFTKNFRGDILIGF